MKTLLILIWLSGGVLLLPVSFAAAKGDFTPEESNLDFDSKTGKAVGSELAGPASAAAREARKQAIAADLAAVNAALAAYPDAASFQRAMAPLVKRNNEACAQCREGKWFGDSFYRPEPVELKKRDTECFADSIIEVKKYLDKLGVDLIVWRAPGRRELAFKYFAGGMVSPLAFDCDHLQLRRKLLENDVEYLDGIEALWQASQDYPLCYWYMLRDGHPAEGYSRIAAAALAERLRRYQLPRTGDYHAVETGDLYHQENYPVGNPKFTGEIRATGVRDAAGKVPAIIEKKSSPLLFTSDSYGAYPGVRVGASVPHYVALLTGHAGDWMYRDGASSSMPPEMLDKGDDFFRGRQVVVMLCHPGNTTFFSTMPDAALRAMKATARLLTFDGGNWRNLQAEPAIGSAAFEIQPDGLLKVNPRKAGATVGDGGKWLIALTPELKKYRALQLTFNFKSHYHFYISADAGAGETFRELPKGGPLRATMPVRLNEQSRELTVFFPRVFSHPKVMPLIKSVQISGLE